MHGYFLFEGLSFRLIHSFAFMKHLILYRCYQDPFEVVVFLFSSFVKFLIDYVES
jgi:hypothetical protein